MTRSTHTQRAHTIRNIGIIAHIDAGKTTCSERLLYYTGKIRTMHEVHDGKATLDFLPEEQRRGITISSAATSTTWRPTRGSLTGIEHTIQLIDTPGHVDFTIEVERCLRVLDGAVAVFDAGNGVEPQSETVWRQADKHGVPRIAFVNKMDKVGADFAFCVASIRDRLGARAIPVQLPLGEQHEFRGIVDLIERRAFAFDTTASKPPVEEPIPSTMIDEVERARAALIEACCEVDDRLLARYLEDGPESITAAEIEVALRLGTCSLALVPVLCGSAYRNIGIEPLLDAIVHFLPSPLDVAPVSGPTDRGEIVTRLALEGEPLCAMAFKITNDKSAGNITWIRVYSGELRAGSTVEIAGRRNTERLGRLMQMHANTKQDITVAGPGSIVAALGLRSVRSGDTLCTPDHAVRLTSFEVPDPVITIAIEPVSSVDQDRLASSLHRMALEDPSLRIGSDVETGRVLLAGMGELHLEVVVSRLRDEHSVDVTTGTPSVAYRETVQKAASANVLFSHQNGGTGMYARVVLEVTPLARGAGFTFVDDVHGGVIPREYIPAIEKGVRAAMQRGQLAGYPMVDVSVRVYDGAFHAKDSNSMAFETAASLAFKEATRNAGITLLEPWMSIEVTTPEVSLGTVVGDISSRRGQVRSLGQRGNARIVEAIAPLASLFGYVPELRGMTRGRASAILTPSHLAEAPAAVSAEVARKS